MNRVLGRSLLFAGACAALPVTAAAQDVPITLEDFYNLASVSEPAFSPDGSEIVYSVSVNVAARDAGESDLWIVPWQGGTLRQLTSTAEASESQPRYAVDGRSLFFLSDGKLKAAGKEDEEDESETQLWTIPVAGGTARRVTAIPGGISEYTLAPDGRRAAVVADVGRRVGNKAENPPPIEIDRLYFKADGQGYIDDRAQQIFVVDLVTGEARQLTQGARDHWAPAWSPNGELIAYVGKDQSTDADLNYEIYVMPPAGGTERKISTFAGADGDPDWGSGPRWSPDSQRLVWLEGGEDKWIYYHPVQLAVGDLATGAVSRPARIDRWFYNPRWTPDGKITAMIEQDRDTWLARIDPANGAIDYLTQGPRLASDYALGADGRIALLDSSNERPAELIALDGGERRLTDHNAWLATRALGETRDVSFSSGEATINGYMVLPPGYDPARKYPLIADLHGGPVYQHSHEFDLDARLLAAAGYVVLKINPRGSSGRGFDFSRAIYADWGNLDAQDISAGISHAIDTGVADPERIAVGGWSYGGILTDYMIASDKRIKAAVSGAGVANIFATFAVDMYVREYLLELGRPWDNLETWTKLAYPFLEPSRITTPTLFQCAEADDNVPCPGAEQMYLALKLRGVPTGLIVYPGENHGLTVPSYLVHRMRSNIAWYDRWLKGTQP